MEPDRRQQILGVALRHFADRGYAGTSVQDIANDAKVAKPMLYYYFQSKAGLYQALIDSAHDERFRVIAEAAEKERTLRGKLTAILIAFFKFVKNHRELVRLAFVSTFASPGELPPELRYKEKCIRGFDFFHELIKAGQKSGEISRKFGSMAVAMEWYGLMNVHMMSQIFEPDVTYDERTAREMVELFFRGADAKGRKKGPVRSSE